MIVPLLGEDSYKLEGRRPAHAAMQVMKRLSFPDWRAIVTDLCQEAAGLGSRNRYPVFVEVHPAAERNESTVGKDAENLLMLRAEGAGDRAQDVDTSD